MADVMENVKHTSFDMRNRLRAYYSKAEWALFFEVIDATGARHTRSADAVAMNTWPSRGLAMHGIEIKVSRSDFLSELKQPAKAEVIAKYCDYWWLCSPKEIVRDGELPETWGHLIPFNGGLKIAKAAVKKEAAPLTRLFVASLLRNASQCAAADVDAMAKALVEKERAEIRETVKREIEYGTQRHRELRLSVEEFEKASGLRINGWSGGADLGKKVAVAEKITGWGGIRELAKGLRSKADALDQSLDDLAIPQGETP